MPAGSASPQRTWTVVVCSTTAPRLSRDDTAPGTRLATGTTHERTLEAMVASQESQALTHESSSSAGGWGALAHFRCMTGRHGLAATFWQSAANGRHSAGS